MCALQRAAVSSGSAGFNSAEGKVQRAVLDKSQLNTLRCYITTRASHVSKKICIKAYASRLLLTLLENNVVSTNRSNSDCWISFP